MHFLPMENNSVYMQVNESNGSMLQKEYTMKKAEFLLWFS